MGVVSAILALLLIRVTHVEATDRADAVASLQRRRRHGGDDHADEAVLVRPRLSAGWLSPPPTITRWRRQPSPDSRDAVPPLFAVALPLGASIPYTLYDGLQIKHLNEVINTVCYGGAIVGSVVAAYLMLLVL